MADSISSSTCVLCNNYMPSNNDDSVALGKKGSISVNLASEERGSYVHTNEGQRVHKECRKRWIDPYYINANKKGKVEKSVKCELRSQTTFEYSKHCILCGQSASISCKKRGIDAFPVRTFDFKTSIEAACKERNDEWSKQVTMRLAHVVDLHAKDSVYHQQCSTNFRTGKCIPKKFQINSDQSAKKPRLNFGRPIEDKKAEAVLFAIKYLEDNDDEQITVTDLVNKMSEYLKSAGSTQVPYAVRYMKQKLLEEFGEKIVITNINGKADVVTFRTTASSILYDHYKNPKCTSDEDEMIRIIESSAKLIKNEIKQLIPDTEYPIANDITTEKALAFIPESLKRFLQIIVVGKNTEKKRASLGHAIIQAARPRVIIAPLQLGLAVQMHHHFGSRFLLDSLHQHGFCSSYREARKFEQSAAVIPHNAATTSDKFVQFSADNVDHNIRTLDGNGTFHGMGMITAVTPARVARGIVPRKTVTAEEILTAGRVDIHQYNYPQGQQSETFSELALLDIQLNVHPPLTDIIWKLSPFLQWPRPGWSGFMQMVHNGNHPGQASVEFLPMIGLDPSSMTCIYSTLLFLAEQARKNNVTPVITFDQPLWWKAYIIIANEPPDSILKSIVLRIGGLHTEMSYLGCVGHLMENSGLFEVLEVVYGSNTVTHMLSGKAVSRARRGHFLIDAALNIHLLADTFKLPIPISSALKSTGNTEIDEETQSSEDNVSNVKETHHHIQLDEEWLEDTTVEELEASSIDTGRSNEEDDPIQIAREIFTKLQSDSSLDENSSKALIEIHEKLGEEKKKHKSSRTSRLWLQYMDMMDILKRFIRAERTGDWNLHLTSLKEMLPFFAAAGHNLYAKTVFLYLQQMAKLPTDHPDIHTLFLGGLHVVRRSNRLWAGLSTDLIIEQMLMRSLKTTGGLTRGRGMTELQRMIWIKSLPACSEINQAMQEFTGVIYHTSDQHRETSNTRQKRDCRDTEKLVDFLQHRNPFKETDTSLRSIVSGVVAQPSVNADQAEAVGQKIIQSMEGESVTKYSFKRKHQAVTLGSRSAIVINKEAVQIDPQILFQRLTLVATRDSVNMKDLFTFELCSYPAALFDRTQTPRPANKAVLADELWSKVKEHPCPPPHDPIYVLDGGALLHRISWPRTAKFQDICTLYVRYIKSKYEPCIVVFDGYSDGPSVKDITHLKRGSNTAASVHCEPDMPLTVKKDVFLGNTKNKQRFIHMLSDTLEQAGYQTVHASGDADVLIVKTAVAAAADRETVVVADDTDILIILCYHGISTNKKIFMRPEPKRGSVTVRVWDIHAMKSLFGRILCKRLLFLHAILGCDTTSHLFGIGKGVGIKKSEQLYKYADNFYERDVSKEDIMTSGENALVAIYSGKPNETLDSLRYRRFCEKVAKSTTSVDIKSIPPTTTAAKFHSLRVYYQVQQWIGNTLQPTDWGWKITDDVMYPQMTDGPPAPANLLKLIRCTCKSGCGSKSCSCRKYGIDCSSACQECHGTACLNSPPIEDDDDVDSEKDIED